MRYNLYKLGSFQFEEIVKALLKAKLGIGIESWGKYKDYGIDAYFKGKLKYPSNIENEGIFIFQIKFSSLTNKKEAFNSLKNGFTSWAKAKRFEIFIDKKFNTFYTLITNVSLTAKQRKNLKNRIKQILKISELNIIIFNGNDICALLDEYPEIRYSYPQILGIQDLNNLISQVINKPFFERSKILIEEGYEYSKVFVPTSPYRKAIEILQKHFFVVLEGPPEVGKTVIAYIIALNKLNDGWEVYDCKIPEDFFRGYKEKKKQIFVADDAFGTTEYDPTRAAEWARELHRILRKLDRKHWFIWTTRGHILKMAKEKMELKDQAEKFPEPGDIIVNVDEFSRLEKAFMLYRHAKSKDLSVEGKFLIKNFWHLIIDNPYFTPLRIKNFIETLKDIPMSKIKKERIEEIIKEHIEKPTESLKKTFNNLPVVHKTLLFSMLDCEYFGKVHENKLKKAFQNHSKDCDDEFEKVLNEMKGTFIIYSYSQWENTNSEKIIRWIHPSIRDLLIEMLKKNNNFKSSFIKNCRLNGIRLLIAPKNENTPSSFLTTENDWTNLIKNIKRNIENFTLSEIGILLRDVAEIKDIYLKSKYKNYFLGFLKIILKGIKNAVQNKEKISKKIKEDIPGIDNRPFIIETFYELSLLFFPDNEITHLNLIFLWEDLFKRARDILNSNWRISEKLGVFENLASLFQIVKKYEPMYLLKFNWESDLNELFVKYIMEIENELKEEVFEDDPEILHGEAEIWSGVAETLKKLKNILVNYNKKLDELIEESKQKFLYYDDKAWECEEEEETVEEEPSPPSVSENVSKNIEISKIFEDL